MNNLTKIFVDEGFKIEIFHNAFFLSKPGKEYFIVDYYTKEEMMAFFKSEKTNKLIEFFNKQKSTSEDIEKNTSLVIFLKLDELNDLKGVLKNQIFKIEEDEYFFKKYIIAYTEKSLEGIDSDNINKSDLLKMINSSGSFDKFQNNNYYDDQFFFVIQLFIKLPFLSYQQESVPIELLEKKINEKLSDKDKKIEKEILSLNKGIEIKRGTKKTEDESIINKYYSELGQLISEEKDNKKIDDFFHNFI